MMAHLKRCDASAARRLTRARASAESGASRAAEAARAGEDVRRSLEAEAAGYRAEIARQEAVS